MFVLCIIGTIDCEVCFMLVSDYVESRLSELQESYRLYLNQFESRSYSSFALG